MFKVIEDLVLFYLLYKLIFDLIIPAVHTTKQVKQQVTDIQNKMNEQANQFNRQQNSPTTQNPSFSKPGKDDDIDFEEIK